MICLLQTSSLRTLARTQDDLKSEIFEELEFEIAPILPWLLRTPGEDKLKPLDVRSDRQHVRDCR